ncbi:MAG: hypothetical protein JSW72_06420 [Candidatus Bathyarchaeota archaeon]|nr:MAG: hypothetical protein JSW72_06420 [Candidatus Bathyarchaeota archaeon]
MRTVQQKCRKAKKVANCSSAKQERLPCPPCIEFHLKEEANRGDFGSLLLEAIDENLASLGDTPKQAIYFCLERHFNMKRREIPNRLEEFADAFEKILGEGAKLLEIRIMKCIYKKTQRFLNHHPLKNELEFIAYLQALKASQNP